MRQIHNSCRKCGVQVYDKNILCLNCVQELSIEEKNKKGKGCLGVFLALIIAVTTLNYSFL